MKQHPHELEIALLMRYQSLEPINTSKRYITSRDIAEALLRNSLYSSKFLVFAFVTLLKESSLLAVLKILANQVIRIAL